MSNNPFISIVIPTRDRPVVLGLTLEAMRLHTSPRIEILVRDNCSAPETRAVVEEAMKLDPRLRYSRSEEPISQRQNFEEGLAAATGDYMSVIGDDDGYCPGSLDWLCEALTCHPVDAVRWRLVQYVWPSLSTSGHGFLAVFPSQWTGTWRLASGKALADQVLNARSVGIWENVGAYHSMISRRIYDRARAKTNGTFLMYPLPDVYGHNVSPFFCDSYLDILSPVSIYGQSGHSSGAAWASSETAKTDNNPGNRWIRESKADEAVAGLPWHPGIRTMHYHDFAVLHFAQEHGLLGAAKPDLDTWIKAILRELDQFPYQAKFWENFEPVAPYDAEILAAVRAHMKTLPAPESCAPRTHLIEPGTASLAVDQVVSGTPDTIVGAMTAIAGMKGTPPYRHLPRLLDFLPERLSKKLAARIGHAGIRRVRRTLKTAKRGLVA